MILTGELHSSIACGIPGKRVTVTFCARYRAPPEGKVRPFRQKLAFTFFLLESRNLIEHSV